MRKRSSWNKIALAAVAVIVPALSCGQRSLVLLDVKASTAFTDPGVLLGVQLTVTANKDLTTRFHKIRLQSDMPFQIGVYLPSDMTGTVNFDATIDNGSCTIGAGMAVENGVQSGDTTQPIPLIISPTTPPCIPIGDGGVDGSGSAGTSGSAGAGGMAGAGGVSGTAGSSAGGGPSCGGTTCVPPYICSSSGQCVCSETPVQACTRSGVACGYAFDNCGQKQMCTICPVGNSCDVVSGLCVPDCVTGTGGIITTGAGCPPPPPQP
jgi:hypothetical protein